MQHCHICSQIFSDFSISLVHYFELNWYEACIICICSVLANSASIIQHTTTPTAMQICLCYLLRRSEEDSAFIEIWNIAESWFLEQVSRYFTDLITSRRLFLHT